tara:strand:+ start:5552 stop:8794 length:3243 start_codon:yes stop_codon:yes gene_type:complete
MVDLTKLRQKDRRPCYVLRIAGVPVLYGTHMPPALSTNGITHARRASIIANDISFSRRHDENARVVEVSNLEIVLSSDEQYTSDQYDPGKIFGRIGFQGADSFTRITANVDPTDVSLTVQDNSGFAAADTIHVGQETMTVTNIISTDTIRVSRGILGTFPRFHRVDGASGSFPYVTKPLTYFRGRRVVVYEGRVNDDGSVSDSLDDYAEVFRGFLASEPAVAVSGQSHEVTLEIAPLTAVLDKPLPASTLKTNLHPILHAFDGTIANKIAVHSFHQTGQMWRSNCEIQLNSSGTEFQYLNREGAAADIDNRFDNDISEFHPRGMAIRCDFTTRNKVLFLGPDSISTDPVSGHLMIHNLYVQSTVTDVLNQTGGGANITGAFVELKSRGGFETKIVRISILGTRSSAHVANWRHLLGERFNSALTTGTHLGLSGFHFDVGLDVSVGEIFISPNFSARGVGSKPAAQFVLSNSISKARSAIQDSGMFPDMFVVLREVIGRQAQSDVDTNAPHDSSNVGYRTILENLPFIVGATQNEFLPSSVLRLDDEDGNARVFHMEAERLIVTDGGTSVHAPLCDAYIHIGNVFNGPGENVPLSSCERFVVFEDSLGVASGTSADVLISQDDEAVAMLRVSNETSVSSDGFTGFQYQVDQVTKYKDIETIADVPGEKRHTVTPTIRPSDESIGQLLVRLLVSADGDSKTSSTHDTMVFGAGLSDGTGHADTFGADIDVDSFLAIPNPIAAEVFGPIYKEGDTLLETVEGLLLAVGYTVDISTNSLGKCKLRAVELTLPLESDVSQTFTTAEIAQKPTPSSSAELSIKNVFKFTANYNHEGDADVEVTVRDQVSIDLFKEAQDLSVDLKGIKLNTTTPGDAVHDLRPLFSKLRLENSFPRRVFTFDVPTSLLQSLALGDTCTVTHPLLRSTSGLGVTTEPARVRSIEYDGYSPTGSIELVAYGTVGQSWNMAANIISIVAGSGSLAVNVSANEHSPTARPSDGSAIEDSSGFHVSQWVDVFSVYDMDAPIVTTKITSINTATNQIVLASSVSGLTFDSLSFGFMGFLVPRDFSNATSDVRKYGFINRTTAT